MNQTTALAPVSAAPPATLSAFSCPEAFETAQRMAKLLCSASIVPESYRQNMGDCVIALEMANRIGANPLAVMQNLYIVHGRPAWSSQFLISCINASGKFTPLRYRMDGDGDNYGCTAWAQDATGERLEGPKVTLAMAKAEGWFGKNGSKWKTMPELMLRYRAATLFARLYAPELTMGIHTDDEIIDISPVVTDPVARAKPVKSLADLKIVKPPQVEPTNEPDDIPGAETSKHFPSAEEEVGQTRQSTIEPPKTDAAAPKLSPKQKGFVELAAKIADEIPGATFMHLVDYARTLVPTWKDEFTHESEIPNSVCDVVLSKSLSAKKWIAEQVKGGAE